VNELAVFEHDNRQWINARDLHTHLEVGRDFSTWIKDRIEECRFEEGREFFLERKFDSPNLGNHTGKRGGDHRSIEYSLSVSAALVLAAKENSPKQREILRLLSQAMEAWNTPEMVRQKAMQLGVMPVHSGGLTEAQAVMVFARLCKHS